MTERLSITFSTVPELLCKVEAIKAFSMIEKQTRVNTLNEFGIIFEDLDEFGVAIDIDKQTPDQMLAIKEILLYNNLEIFVKELESCE